MEDYKIPDGTGIGHVYLKVSNLQKSLDFYCGLLGFDLVMKYRGSEPVKAAGTHSFLPYVRDTLRHCPIFL